MTTTATTRPVKRSRKAASVTEEASATPVKAQGRKKADKATENTKPRDLSEGNEQKFRVDLENVKSTKNYEVFEVPEGLPLFGKLWVPQGATEVIVLVKGVSA